MLITDFEENLEEYKAKINLDKKVRFVSHFSTMALVDPDKMEDLDEIMTDLQ
jgi:hypothetical protein